MTLFAEQHMSCKRIPAQVFSGEILPSPKGVVFNIQRYSLNDGQGIRTVVFFKGCPLKCPWCANPESRSHHIEHIRRESKCLHCENCSEDVQECPSGAFESVGNEMTLDQVMKEIIKDEIFFRTSGGGVTLSGGEVLSQSQFAIALLSRLKKMGIHTAIETSGHGKPEHLYQIASLCDEVLFDLKIMDEVQAKQVIGINLSRVLKNFTGLIERKVHVIPRLPLIPGYTLSVDNLQRVLTFLSPFNLKEIHILPFHQYGAKKYEMLQMKYSMHHVKVPSESEVQEIKKQIEAFGYQVIIGG